MTGERQKERRLQGASKTDAQNSKLQKKEGTFSGKTAQNTSTFDKKRTHEMQFSKYHKNVKAITT